MGTERDAANTTGFWDALDRLVACSAIRIDRLKGSAHPRFPDTVYPLDYGYLSGTRGGDGGEVDVWVGTLPERAHDPLSQVGAVAAQRVTLDDAPVCRQDHGAPRARPEVLAPRSFLLLAVPGVQYYSWTIPPFVSYSRNHF